MLLSVEGGLRSGPRRGQADRRLGLLRWREGAPWREWWAAWRAPVHGRREATQRLPHNMGTHSRTALRTKPPDPRACPVSWSSLEPPSPSSPVLNVLPTSQHIPLPARRGGGPGATSAPRCRGGPSGAAPHAGLRRAAALHAPATALSFVALTLGPTAAAARGAGRGGAGAGRGGAAVVPLRLQPPDQAPALAPQRLADWQAAYEAGDGRVVQVGLTWTLELPGGASAAAAQLLHRVPLLGIRVAGAPRAGGPRGPWGGGGRGLAPAEGSGPGPTPLNTPGVVRPGRKLVLLGDTTSRRPSPPWPRGADLVSHEATFCAREFAKGSFPRFPGRGGVACLCSETSIATGAAARGGRTARAQGAQVRSRQRCALLQRRRPHSPIACPSPPLLRPQPPLPPLPSVHAGMQSKARIATHSHAALEAGRFAAQVGARLLVLTHFSARYDTPSRRDGGPEGRGRGRRERGPAPARA